MLAPGRAGRSALPKLLNSTGLVCGSLTLAASGADSLSCFGAESVLYCPISRQRGRFESQGQAGSRTRDEDEDEDEDETSGFA